MAWSWSFLVDPASPAPQRILVVDDQRQHRDKLVLAVRALGHEAEAVDGGARALRRLVNERFDLVLLDLLMPEIDGFEIMEFMRRDRRLADIPVIVVSALESEMDAVVRAVEAGAEDVLPKHFDSVLLAARLDSALLRVRVREREREHRHHMQRLIDAAALIEHGAAATEPPGLAETSARGDAIGRLARVFVQMTRQVAERERQMHSQLRLLRNAGLVLAVAVVLGLVPPLARFVLTERPLPLALALWLGGLSGAVCLAIALWRGGLASLRDWPLKHVLAIALFGGVAGVMPLLWLLNELPANVVATVLPLEAFLAMIIAAVLRRRVSGVGEVTALTLGVAAGAVLLLGIGPFESPWQPQTLGIALIVPLGWALAGLTLSRGAASVNAEQGDALVPVGLAALIATLFMVPFAVWRGELVPLFGGAGDAIAAGLVLLLLGIVLATGATLRVALARSAGKTVSALSSFAIAVGAIAWSVVVLGERVPMVMWPAMTLCALGLAARGLFRRLERTAAVGVTVLPDIRLD